MLDESIAMLQPGACRTWMATAMRKSGTERGRVLLAGAKGVVQLETGKCG